MPTRSHNNIRLLVAIDQYEQRLGNVGQAEKTIYTSHYALARFATAMEKRLGRNPWLHLVSAADCDDYCYGPTGIRRGVGSAHFNRQRSVLKVFFEHALRQRWVDVNPMDGIAPARPDAKKPRLLLTATELLTLMELTGNPVERIGCALGMNTGLRGNDIRHLTIFDANLIGGTIQTEIRKTRKLATKQVPVELDRELRRWFVEYARVMGLPGPEALPNDWLLVPSYRLPAPNEKQNWVHPRPTTVHTKPWLLVQRPLSRMGYPTKQEGFHTLRRSSARALFESLRADGEGRDHALMVVKEFLNHSSVTMTEHYLGLNHEQVILDSLLRNKPFLSALAETEQGKSVPNIRESRGA